MSNRSMRAKIAQETITILETGEYIVDGLNRVNFQENLKRSVENTQLLTPQELASLSKEVAFKCNGMSKYYVENTSSLAASRALVESGNKVLCLNFASAKNPGGGFLGGSQAQEESLARASGIYASLIGKGERYYSANRELGSCLYTSHMIYTPQAPVFRDDNDELLREIWSCSFLTAPAVNYGALKEHERSHAKSVMQERIDFVLAFAISRGYSHLVLGAWGCGVFRNDPDMIADLFGGALLKSGKYENAFSQFVFAVLDSTSSGHVIQAFRNRFG